MHECGLDFTGGIRCEMAIKSVARLRRMWFATSSGRYRSPLGQERLPTGPDARVHRRQKGHQMMRSSRGRGSTIWSSSRTTSTSQQSSPRRCRRAERGANPNQDLLSAGDVSIVAKAIEGDPRRIERGALLSIDEGGRAYECCLAADRRTWSNAHLLETHRPVSPSRLPALWTLLRGTGWGNQKSGAPFPG